MSLVLNFEEGGEQNVLEGDAASEGYLHEIVGAPPVVGGRDLNVESLFAYGGRAGFWRVHRTVAAHGVPLTVHAVAQALERNPAAARAMAAAGRPHLVLPYSLDANDFKFLIVHGFTTADDMLTYLVDTFDALHAEGADRPRMMSVGLHCRIIGRPGRIRALDGFLRHVAQRGGAWVTTRERIALHRLRAHPPRLSAPCGRAAVLISPLGDQPASCGRLRCAPVAVPSLILRPTWSGRDAEHRRSLAQGAQLSVGLGRRGPRDQLRSREPRPLHGRAGLRRVPLARRCTPFPGAVASAAAPPPARTAGGRRRRM